MIESELLMMNITSDDPENPMELPGFILPNALSMSVKAFSLAAFGFQTSPGETLGKDIVKSPAR
jgi:hypothetical protein